ncbi:MAG: substrate-binding domain-containing protein [Actinomycetota bacterium]|nr:substrate-binding domain-containing protein [Actinomycetota bacterium]
MKKVFRTSTVLLVVGLAAAAAITVAAATAGTSKKAAGGDVCVLFPETATSIRWVHYDAPAMKAALKASGVTAQIYNANSDAQKQKAQADQCLASGAKVIVEVAVDAGSASAIEKEALAKGIPSIDYDRQTKGGVAKIYVSFDGKAVGVLQGQGVVNGLKSNGKYSQHPVVAEVNGGSVDANAFLFKGGYDSVLKPLYKNGTFKKGPDQFVPGWNNQTAGTIFDQMLVKTGNKIDAVAVANDGMAGAVIASLKKAGLKPIPVTGQDATSEGFQNIISGWQTMTVWKDTRVLAKAAAKAAVQLIKGQKLTTTGSVPNGSKKEPAFIIAPVALYKSNWTKIYTSGFLKKSDICTGSFKKYC